MDYRSNQNMIDTYMPSLKNDNDQDNQNKNAVEIEQPNPAIATPSIPYELPPFREKKKSASL